MTWVRVITNDTVSFVLDLISDTVYIVMLILSLTLFSITLYKTSKYPEWRIQRMFLFFLSLALSIRVFFFSLIVLLDQNVIFVDWADNPNFIRTLEILPVAFFLTSYSILLFFWAKIYHFRSYNVQVIKKLLIIVNLSIYIVLFAGLIVYYTNPLSNNVMFYISHYTAAGYSLLFAAGFIFYGFGVSSVYRGVEEIQHTVVEGRKLVRAVIFVCTTSFLFRGAVLILETIADLPWAFQIVCLSIVEIAPSILMLFIFRHVNPEVGLGTIILQPNHVAIEDISKYNTAASPYTRLPRSESIGYRSSGVNPTDLFKTSISKLSKSKKDTVSDLLDSSM
eukprot:TRINITY_DN20731_c0_g1_i1.p1 TRINITY_DN20731_c0_g1~~TRINITY_DN20731_c0_g1_i1.p1  ORF type:complete len:336 (-),score=23.76 TRINITY_DN20731_c0_g1_i1:8-1015(-)